MRPGGEGENLRVTTRTDIKDDKFKFGVNGLNVIPCAVLLNQKTVYVRVCGCVCVCVCVCVCE